MNRILLLLYFVSAMARDPSFKKLECIDRGEYKTCKIEPNGDYKLDAFNGKIPIYCEHKNQMFFNKGREVAFAMDRILYVPKQEWSTKKWFLFLDKLTI